MVQTIIKSQLREKAGSDSYNRFEYQVHWIVYHMIQEFSDGADFFIFCEFHDDMAKTSLEEMPNCAEFFQVKTTKRFKKWTFSNLFQTTKKKKHSFLGFLFYNFLNFKNECTRCHFVSNIDMDEEIKNWTSTIEDKKSLKLVHPDLYKKIKKELREEYTDLDEETFNSNFDIFIQNTFLYYGDLPLEGYEKIVAGSFFTMLENDEIYTSNSNKILKDLIEEVRKKTKKTIDTPISYHSLKKEKGISSKFFSKIKDQTRTLEIHDDKELFAKIKENYSSHLSDAQINILIRILNKHKGSMLNFSNSLYINNSQVLLESIDSILVENYNRLKDYDYIATTILKEVMETNQYLINGENDINQVLVEALFYERVTSF